VHLARPGRPNPDTGAEWRVCDLVRAGEEILGARHDPQRAAPLARVVVRTYGGATWALPTGAGQETPEGSVATKLRLAARRQRSSMKLMVSFPKRCRLVAGPSRRRLSASCRTIGSSACSPFMSGRCDLSPPNRRTPWNLASTLDSLGLSPLALGYMARAIQAAEETGDDKWAGADAHLALAEIALRAGEPDLAVTALASALVSAPEDHSVQEPASSLLEGDQRGDGHASTALGTRREAGAAPRQGTRHTPRTFAADFQVDAALDGGGTGPHRALPARSRPPDERARIARDDAPGRRRRSGVAG
jgi:hypothetical protein